MFSSEHRECLRRAARNIAARRGEAPASPGKALRKLVLQERRDWSRPGFPRIGWKRGEIFEVLLAALGRGNLEEEWGDVGYYVAQSFTLCWVFYAIVTPRRILPAACEKFTRRAEKPFRIHH